MDFARREAPYLKPTTNVASIMLHVLAALVPAALAHVWYFGPGFIINLVIAAFSGAAIPLVLRKLGIDPAIAGSVVVTTVTDIVGLFVFLGLATMFLI